MARWLEQIAEHNFTAEHRPGRKHANADGLSRTQCKQCGRERKTINTSALYNASVSPAQDDIECSIRGSKSQPSFNNTC